VRNDAAPRARIRTTTTVLTILLAVALAASGCSSSNGAKSSAAKNPAGIRTDQFTARSKRLDLTVALASKRAVTKVIGSAGGQLAATGPDRTRYVLTVPAKALPMSTTITMVPIANVRKWPVGAPPAHRLGVALYPEGLQLATPGTLTITPAGPLPASGIATLSAQANGSDAALVLHKRVRSGESISIPHFSSWVAVYPIEDATIRTIINEWQTEAERELEATVAAQLSVRRQEELLGTAQGEFLTDDVLDELTTRYTDEVLEPRLRLADGGCLEANEALQAYIAYERIIELAGVAESKERYAKYGRPIPDSLIQTTWRLCEAEQLRRCRQTGDIPYFEAFLLGITRQLQLLGAEVPDSWERTGIADLERCGQWEAKIDTYENGLNEWEAERDITVKWHPGGGDFGFLGQEMRGEGSITTLKKKSSVFTIGKVSPRLSATAEITSFSFDEPPWYLPGTSPTAHSLTMQIGMGALSFQLLASVGCDQGTNCGPDYQLSVDPEYFVDLEDALLPDSGTDPNIASDPRDAKAWTLMVDHDWQFDLRPYRAYFSESRSSDGVFTGRVEILLKHTPA